MAYNAAFDDLSHAFVTLPLVAVVAAGKTADIPIFSLGILFKLHR